MCTSHTYNQHQHHMITPLHRCVSILYKLQFHVISLCGRAASPCKKNANYRANMWTQGAQMRDVCCSQCDATQKPGRIVLASTCHTCVRRAYNVWCIYSEWIMQNGATLRNLWLLLGSSSICCVHIVMCGINPYMSSVCLMLMTNCGGFWIGIRTLLII